MKNHNLIKETILQLTQPYSIHNFWEEMEDSADLAVTAIVSKSE